MKHRFKFFFTKKKKKNPILKDLKWDEGNCYFNFRVKLKPKI